MWLLVKLGKELKFHLIFITSSNRKSNSMNSITVCSQATNNDDSWYWCIDILLYYTIGLSLTIVVVIGEILVQQSEFGITI